MSLSFVVFFTSLIGIIFMIWRKRSLIKGMEISDVEEVLFEIPDMEKWKRRAAKRLKKYAHLSLVEIIRFNIRLSNLLRNKYEEIKIRIKNRNKENASTQKKETSKFLKMVSDYKKKVRRIKQRIYEEEEENS